MLIRAAKYHSCINVLFLQVTTSLKRVPLESCLLSGGHGFIFKPADLAYPPHIG